MSTSPAEEHFFLFLIGTENVKTLLSWMKLNVWDSWWGINEPMPLSAQKSAVMASDYFWSTGRREEWACTLPLNVSMMHCTITQSDWPWDRIITRIVPLHTRGKQRWTWWDAATWYSDWSKMTQINWHHFVTIPRVLYIFTNQTEAYVTE